MSGSSLTADEFTALLEQHFVAVLSRPIPHPDRPGQTLEMADLAVRAIGPMLAREVVPLRRRIEAGRRREP